MQTLKSPRRPSRKRTSDPVKIRKALARDKAPILEITKNIWGGHDYYPEVWDDWLADKKGRLIVATVNGRTIGVAHASMQANHVAWLEGVRVHEQYRGFGIAGKLNSALVEWARRHGARVARLCTGSSNRASRKHLKKIGFPMLQTFQRLDSLRGLRTKPSGVSIPKRSSESIWNWLSTRPNFVENHAMYSDGWTWYPLNKQVLRRLMARARVLVTSRNGQLSSCCIFLVEEKVVTMGYVAGEQTDILKLVRMLRFLVLRKKRERLRIILPSRSSLVRVLQRSGFEKTAKIITYEKFLGEQ
jgi:GNAT superfamily N-acetyltransferase